ncbi:MAG: VOC family protein [Planctomycetota bacterium]
MMTAPMLRSVLALLTPALVLCAYNQGKKEPAASEAQASKTVKAIQVQYLEVVTPDVDSACSALEKVHGVSFGKPEPALGNARTAPLAGGGRMGVRAPMHEYEKSVVRPYVLVDDLGEAVKAATAAGGQFAIEATEIPGYCRFALYFQGDTEYGLWEMPKKSAPLARISHQA